jgi:hypothetical protein
MSRKFIASLVFAALTTVAGQAAAPEGDIGLEVHARDITMPSPDRGTIIYKQCSACPERELGTTPNTSYEIGNLQVRRDDLRRELMRRPEQLMLLQLTPDHKAVARLKISATAY